MANIEDDRERYVDKVRKILAKAERAGTPEESQAFFAKAADLITRWRIEDIELHGASDVIEKRQINLGTYTPSIDAIAMKHVLTPLGIQLGYSKYRGKGTKPYVVLMGWTNDLNKAELLWAAIEIQLVTAMKSKEPNFGNRNELREWRQSFKLGFARVVGERMTEAAQVVVQEAVLAKPGLGLVLVSKQEQLDQEFRAGTLPGRATSVTMSHSGLIAGRQAGASADLGGTRLQHSPRKAIA